MCNMNLDLKERKKKLENYNALKKKTNEFWKFEAK